ncbi:MAG: TetR/AcrR family transcriptional regulator [Acidobacteria bacterium]|nr:MAG: TetR/AcrR family transcriptional regulator [Acidobacteriota bacterium]
MPRPARPDRKAEPQSPRNRILEAAARLICEKGYDAASIQDIADATGLTKAGLYHHIRSKESLLLEIQHYGMDVFEEKVLSQVVSIADPLERLKACMEKNVLLVTHGWSKEVTIILHEHATLTGESRSQINARKKRYVTFLETSFAEAVRVGSIRAVNPTVAAFALLGMVLWIYKWFRADGPISAEQLAREMQDLFFGGLETKPPVRGPRKPRRG